MLSVVAGVDSLPAIIIMLSLQGAGTIRSIIEKSPLIAPLSACISRVLAVHDDRVVHGQKLLVFDEKFIEEEVAALANAIRLKRDSCQ